MSDCASALLTETVNAPPCLPSTVPADIPYGEAFTQLRHITYHGRYDGTV